jgi:hypothetical protein
VSFSFQGRKLDAVTQRIRGELSIKTRHEVAELHFPIHTVKGALGIKLYLPLTARRFQIITAVIYSNSLRWRWGRPQRRRDGGRDALAINSGNRHLFPPFSGGDDGSNGPNDRREQHEV